MPSSPASTGAREREATIALVDGRALSYIGLGAEAGPTVLVLDGPGSRGLARAAAGAAAAIGVQLVAPDRAGFFGSTPMPGNTFAAVAARVDRRVGDQARRT